jgi:hypothetical protein
MERSKYMTPEESDTVRAVIDRLGLVTLRTIEAAKSLEAAFDGEGENFRDIGGITGVKVGAVLDAVELLLRNLAPLHFNGLVGDADKVRIEQATLAVSNAEDLIRAVGRKRT